MSVGSEERGKSREERAVRRMKEVYKVCIEVVEFRRHRGEVL